MSAIKMKQNNDKENITMSYDIYLLKMKYNRMQRLLEE